MIASAQRQGDEDALVARVGVHVVLLSHAHGNHMGDRKMSAQNAGTCAAPDTISAAAHSTTAEIAAAYIVNELVRPATVIASHPNEAVTEGGKLLPNSRMKAFIDLVKDRPVYLSLSGKTMEFDSNAKCVAGC